MPESVLVSGETRDDAAVYLLPGGQALVQTVDFFTPIVDDPFDWGRIAAANAFSDVYAMGGRPLLAMNLVAWPVEELPLDLLSRVLEGGATVATQAGVTIVGGHSIHDPEPKYGMAVTGLVDPERIVRNSTMRPGDRLFLTKPLGLGIVSTAIKAGQAGGALGRGAGGGTSPGEAPPAGGMRGGGVARGAGRRGQGVGGRARARGGGRRADRLGGGGAGGVDPGGGRDRRLSTGGPGRSTCPGEPPRRWRTPSPPRSPATGTKP